MPSDVGSISILFKGKGNKISEFEVTRATRNFYRYRQESVKFSELADVIEKRRKTPSFSYVDISRNVV